MTLYIIAELPLPIHAVPRHTPPSRTLPSNAMPFRASPRYAPPNPAPPNRATPHRAWIPRYVLLPFGHFVSSEEWAESSQSKSPAHHKCLAKILKCAILVLLIGDGEGNRPRKTQKRANLWIRDTFGESCNA